MKELKENIKTLELIVAKKDEAEENLMRALRSKINSSGEAK